MRRLHFFGFLSAVAIVGCGGSSTGSNQGSLSANYRLVSSIPSSQNTGVVEITDDGNVTTFTPTIGYQGDATGATAYVNGQAIPLAPPPAGANMSVFNPWGLHGSHMWALYTDDTTSKVGTLIWDLSKPNQAPIQMASFQVAAVRPDGLMAVGYLATTNQTVFCDPQGQTSTLVLPSQLKYFYPTCMNMKNQMAGMAGTAQTIFLGRPKSGDRTADPTAAFYVMDGKGGSTLLQGTDSQTSTYTVSSININGECVGWSSSLPGNAAAYWNSKGQQSLIHGVVQGVTPSANFITDSSEILGDDTQSYPTSNPAIIWRSPSQAPMTIDSATTGQAVNAVSVTATSPSGNWLVVASDTRGTGVVITRSSSTSPHASRPSTQGIGLSYVKTNFARAKHGK